jgi:hypothetical protein
MFLYKWPLYNLFWPFFCHLYGHLSQNWGSDGHFEMLNKRKYFHFFSFFLWFRTKTDIFVFCIFCVFVFFVITFAPIKILSHWAPQNYRQNLSFVKDKHVVCKIMARYGLKMTIYQLLFFGSSPNLQGASGYIWRHNFWLTRDIGICKQLFWTLHNSFFNKL